jgi:hypothetical protein
MLNIAESNILKYLFFGGFASSLLYFGLFIFFSIAYIYGINLILNQELSYGKPYNIFSVFVILRVVSISF